MWWSPWGGNRLGRKLKGRLNWQLRHQAARRGNPLCRSFWQSQLPYGLGVYVKHNVWQWLAWGSATEIFETCSLETPVLNECFPKTPQKVTDRQWGSPHQPLGMSPRICISATFPGDAAVADPASQLHNRSPGFSPWSCSSGSSFLIWTLVFTHTSHHCFSFL